MEQEETARTISQITGLSLDVSLQLLQQFGSMDAAINSFFETPEATSSNVPVLPEEPEVRAPIPKKREQLLEQSDFRRRRGAVITEIPFRNFELEGQIHEEMLMHGGQVPVAKKSRIEALFMPPFDILFSGTFEMACDYGKKEDKWVLVNLQDDFSFACQTLNRDLWSDTRVKSIVKDHIIFWQQSNKTVEGSKFKAFYKVINEPYIGFIDPRTGEEVQKVLCTNITPNILIQTIKNFLVDQKSPCGIEIPEINPSGNSNYFSQSKKSNNNEKVVKTSHKKKKPVEIQHAYEDSFEEPEEEDSQDNTTAFSNNEKDTSKSNEKNGDDKSEPVKSIEGDPIIDEENMIPASEKTRLLLKLPENKTDVMFCRKTNTLKDIIGRIMKKLGKKDRLFVTLFCPAIKKDLSDLDENKTLLELNIHPSAVIHVGTY